MRILGIETSCDDTGAAILDEDGVVLSDVIHNQVAAHAPYGGVVPELAARDHLRNLRPVIGTACERAGTALSEIGGIAVTCRPGLSGALLVGVQTARGLGFSLGCPVVGVDHLVGHLLAAFLRYPDLDTGAPPVFPFVALLASGGHTALYRVEGREPDQIREIGATRDDAAGEAFDKVAKLLGLGYPGGPVIDRLARDGDPEGIAFGWPMRARASFEFSFSGLKSSVARYVERQGRPGDDQRLRDLCASFQRRVVDTLVNKSVAAAEHFEVATLVLGGGVAANSELRERAAARCGQAGLRLVVPPLRACTDNAAMIANAGLDRLQRGEDDSAGITVSPDTALFQVTHKGRGRR